MRKSVWLILFLSCSLFLNAQKEQMSPEEIKLEQRAFALFKQGNYNDAMPLFSQLLSIYPKEADYNFGFGVCMVELNRDIPKALKYLLFASGESQNPVVLYYIGRCYHLLFRFDEAITRYDEFKRNALKQEIIKYEVDRKIDMCNSGRELLKYISDLTVIDNKKIQSENYYYSYDLKDFGGKLILKPVELKSKTDKKLEPQNSLAFLSKATGQLFFASYDKLKNRDIYRVKLNNDGSFGIPENLGTSVNTPWEEDFPVLHSDSVTLFFSSKGHNSMGGYDIFKSTLDSSTFKFSRPVNMDFPVNTPYDDYLYISDSEDYYAFFASNRETSENKISIYKIIVDKNPIPRQFDNLEEIQQKSLLEVSAADVIRKAEEGRAKQEVKPDKSTVILGQDKNKLSFTPVTYSPAVTQTQLVEEASKDVQALKEQSNTYNKQAQQAYIIADAKNKESEEKRLKSAEINRDLYKYTDAVQKENRKEEAYQLIEEAEQLEKEAVTAFNLAKNFETKEALVESLNQNREKLNQAQNKYITPVDEANSRLNEANVRKKEYDYYSSENEKIETNIVQIETEIEDLEKKMVSATSEEKDDLNSKLFDKQEQLADYRQKKSAIEEPLEKSENEYNNLITEAKIYNNINESLSSQNITADATNLNKNELEQKIFDTELKIDVNSANQNNNQVSDNTTTVNNNTVDYVTKTSVKDSVNSIIEEKRNQLANTQNAEERQKLEKEISDLEFLADNTNSQNSNVNNNERVNAQNDFSNTQILPESRKKEFSVPHTNYQQELLNARFFESMASEQKKQLDVLNQMSSGDPSLEKQISKQKEDLEKQIALNSEKAKTSREKAKQNSSKLSAQEVSDTLSTVKYLNDGYDYGSGVEVKYSEEQNTLLDEIDEQKAVLLTKQNVIAQKVKLYSELKVQKQNSKSQERIMDIEDQMEEIISELEQGNPDYKKGILLSVKNEYNFYDNQTDSRKFHKDNLTESASTVEKEADLLNEKAVLMIENAEVIEDPIQKFKEYQKAAEVNRLAVSKQKYAFELYVKAEEEAKKLAVTPGNPNNNNQSQVVKTTLGADEAEQLKVYRKESGKAENIIAQADKKLEEINARREQANNTYSPADKKKLLKDVDKEEAQAKKDLLTGLEKMSYADSNKYAAYRSQTQTMLSHQDDENTNKAIARQYLKESDFFFEEAAKIKNQAKKEINIDNKLATMKKVTEMEKKALTSQELAVELLSQPDPVLFVSTGNLTRVDRLEAIDQTVSTEEVVKIRTDRIINKINPTDADLKKLDAATQKTTVVQKLHTDADNYKKQIDSLKTVLNTPDANAKDRSTAQKKIAPLEKKYMASVFSAAELTEQINDTRFYMYKDYIKTTRLNNNSTEDRQSKQLERDANSSYSKAKSMRDRSFVTENPDKAYGLLVDANNLENKAIEDMERAFGLNLKLAPLEDEIKEYAETRKQRIAPEYETYLVKTQTNVTPIETQQDTLIADNSNNATSDNNNTRVVADNNSNQNNVPDSSDNNNTQIVADNNSNQNNIPDNNNNATSDNNNTRVVADNNSNQNNVPDSSDNNNTQIVADNNSNQNNVPDNNNNATSDNNNSRVVSDNNSIRNNVIPSGDNRIFSVLPVDAYGSANPIPHNPQLPEGLVFKVQIGAFRNFISNNAFGGLNPVNSETIAGTELIRYVVGLFRSTEAAFIARDQVRKMGFRDAFVVAYMNGKRINISEARRIIASQSGEEYQSLAANETAVMNNRVTSPAENTTANVNTTNNAATANYSYTDVTTNKDLFYTVQIGVYKSPVSPSELKNLNPIYEEKTQGFIRYTTGIFTSPEQANTEKNKIVQMGINDAFVSAYYKGQKISLTEARRISQGGQQSTGQPSGVTYPEQPIQTPHTNSYTKESIVFKVQVGAYKEQVPVDMVNRFIVVARNQPLSQQAEGTTTYYMVGSFNSYDDAVKTKDSIVNDGLKDAFVVAYAGTKKIPVAEALKILNE